MRRLTFSTQSVETSFQRWFDGRCRTSLALSIRAALLAAWSLLFFQGLLIGGGQPSARRTAVLLLLVAGILVQACSVAYLQWFVDPFLTSEKIRCFTTVALVGVVTALAGLTTAGEVPLAHPLLVSGAFSWHLVMEGTRLVTLLKVMVLVFEGFCFAEAHAFLSQRSAQSVVRDMTNCLLFAVVLPLITATWLEARARLHFLQRTRKPSLELGPFWTCCVRKLPYIQETASKRGAQGRKAL